MGGLPEAKKDVQRHFIDGELHAITVTNAFGMANSDRLLATIPLTFLSLNSRLCPAHSLE